MEQNNFGISYITSIAIGYWKSSVLLSSVKLGVFDFLAKNKNGCSASEVCVHLGIDEKNGILLINALVALKLLKKEGNLYFISKTFSPYLVEDSMSSLHNWLKIMGRWQKPWSELYSMIVAGGIQIEKYDFLVKTDSGYLKDFILGMHEYANITIKDFKKYFITKHEKGRLLDIGGGGGTYSIAIKEMYPEMEVVLMDLPEVLPLAEDILKSVSEIRSESLDYIKDDFPACDIFLFSNVIHQESNKVCISILEKAYKSLNTDGEIFVQGHFLNDDKTSPQFSVLHNISSKLLWDNNLCYYTISEFREILERSGFKEIEILGSNGLTIFKSYKK